MIASERQAPTNLPPERTSFVGRRRDLESLVGLIGAGERLITLVGPAGSGKTRLARRAASRLLATPGQAPAGGVWFCDLTEARSREEVLTAVSATLDAPLAHGSTAEAAVEQIGHALAARPPLLLVLDNFEQLVDHASTSVAAWQALAPEVIFLITSRARVKLEGETAYEVAELDEEEAVDLFADRARKVLPSFDRHADEAAIRELVRRLDRSPLGIELAAARVRVLPPRKLLDRLAARLDLLQSKHRDTPPRHVTLRTALDGSWDLLEPWEKQALAQCSSFQGGFTLEAAEAVLVVDALPARQRAVDLLEALADKSLLARDDAPAGEVRFRLLETVREYARGKLRDDQPSDAAVWQRHAEHYLGEAEAWMRSSLAPWNAGSGRGLSGETGNLMAIARRNETRDPATLARAALCLDAALAARSPIDARRDVLDKALRALDPGDAATAELSARVLVASANAHRLRGHLAEARAELGRHAHLPAIGLGGDTPHPGSDDAALARIALAHLELDAGRLDDARSAARRAIDLARAGSDPRVLVIAIHTLARVHVDADELDEARVACDEALPMARRLEMPLVESRVQNLLGVIAARDGRLQAAESHYEASIEIARELDDVYQQITGTVNLADLHARRADREGAVARFEEALAVSRRMGFRRVQGLIMNHLGLVEHDAQELDAARASHEEALAIHREVDNVRSEAFGLEAAGLLALEDGRLADAVTLLERSLAIADEHHMLALLGQSGAHLASTLAAKGLLDDARRAIGTARAAASSSGRPEPIALCDIHEAILWAKDPASARLADARRRLEDTATVAAGSVRVRIACRILERALAERPESGADPAAAARESRVPESVHATLEVGAEGRWFRRGAGERIDISRRRSLRLLVQRLARLRLDAPGEALSLEALFEAGWPGENISQAAAFRRVYTAIGILRDFGMRDILVRRDDGYLLSPAASVIAK